MECRSVSETGELFAFVSNSDCSDNLPEIFSQCNNNLQLIITD